MPRIECTECHKEISDKAKICPYCGYPKRTKKLSKNAKRIIGIIFLIILVITGVWSYNIEQARIIKAQKAHNELIEDLSYPSRPNSYEELYSMLGYHPISPENRQALWSKCYHYESMGTPFESTPFYNDWNTYRQYFTNIEGKSEHNR